MRSIFFRIYSGILCAVILIGSGAVVGYRYWNEDRLSQYLLESSRGTLQLIGEGLARHQDERRAQWLALSQRVTSLQIELITSKQIPDDSIPLHNATGNTDWRLKVLDAEHRLLLHRPDPNKDEWIRVILKEAGINEQLMRGTQLLLLNELGRVPKAERGNVLKRLQSQFSYPLQWLKKADINTNYLQQRALARGDTVVDFFTLASGRRAIRTLAPIGNSGDFLQLGPLPLFDSFPRTLILLSGLLALGLLAIACFLLVKPLERRLSRMTTEVDGIQLTGESDQISVDGNDALTALATKINAMSNRIHQLLNAQRELNRAVSHELKTPLARLKFRRELALQKLELLGANGNDITPVAQHLNGMESSLQELQSLVEEILLYARLESTAPQLELSEVALSPLLEELIDPMQSQYPNLDFRYNTPSGLSLYADRYYLKRALHNLLSNAQRYATSQVSIVIERQSDSICIHVDDDGPGIPETLWQQVLEPFSRGESSRNRQTGGTGLGLAIVCQIARWHQAEINICRSHFGGTRASLRLTHTGLLPEQVSEKDKTVTN